MYSDDQTLVSVVCIGVRCALATGHAAIIHGARRNGGVVFFAPMALRRHFESALQTLTDARDHGALLSHSLLSTRNFFCANLECLRASCLRVLQQYGKRFMAATVVVLRRSQKYQPQQQPQHSQLTLLRTT